GGIRHDASIAGESVMQSAPPRPNHRIETPAVKPKTQHEIQEEAWKRRVWGWQCVCFVVAAIALVLAIGFVLKAQGDKNQPYAVYVIEVRDDGTVRKVQMVDPEWRPSEVMVHAQLRKFVKTLRGRIPVPPVTREMWEEALRYTTTRGATLLGEAYRTT